MDKRVVVPIHPKRGNKLLPPSERVTISDAPKDPGAMPFVGVLLGIEYAGGWEIVIVDLCVFSVHVKDRIAQYANGLGSDRCPAQNIVTSDRSCSRCVLTRDAAKFQHLFPDCTPRTRGASRSAIFTPWSLAKLRVLDPIRRDFHQQHSNPAGKFILVQLSGRQETGFPLPRKCWCGGNTSRRTSPPARSLDTPGRGNARTKPVRMGRFSR